jgi:hypothetical protein
LPSARKKHTSTFRHFFVFFGIQKIWLLITNTPFFVENQRVWIV